MAIVGPADLHSVLKVKSDPCKKYIFSKLGYPQVNVEIHEDQLETLLRTAGDFIAGYFPREQRLAVFYTTPLKNTYPMPADAYWIQSCNWDPLTTRIDDVFGAESFLFNIGNISGIQNILVDYHLLASYRKFSQRVLGSEGHWEVIGETDGTGDGDSLTSNQQLIRLYPTPKGYIPVVNHFRSPQARYLTYEMMLAEARIAIGNARRKINGMPTPDGGSISFDGAELISEGEEKKKEIINEAILLGEPLSVHTW